MIDDSDIHTYICGKENVMPKAEANRFLDEYKKSRDLMEAVERLFDANPDGDGGEL